MKENKTMITLMVIFFFLCIVGCSNNSKIEHIHEYIDGICSCGDTIDIVYNVKFLDYDGTVLKEQKVVKNESAIAPNVQNRENYEFIGWSQSYENVMSDLIIIAQYKEIKEEHIHEYIDGVCICGKTDVFNHEHAYNIKKVEATCINREYTKYKCVFCDYEYKEFTIGSEKLKHNLINDVCEYCNSTRDSNGILYRFDDLSKEYCVVGVDNPIGEVEILSKYNDFAVTTISDYAFYHCEGIKNIIIPNSVVSIGFGAFCDCIDLINITIPNSITKIEPATFLFCFNLKEIIIPESITSIGELAFTSCTSLTSITIPKSVTSIGEGAFSSCSSLTSITIPKSVTSIGEDAFSSCSSLSIYCEVMSQPVDWNLNWNPDSCYIEWGYNN